MLKTLINKPLLLGNSLRTNEAVKRWGSSYAGVGLITAALTTFLSVEAGKPARSESLHHPQRALTGYVFDNASLIGVGQNAKVSQARDLSTGKTVAIKIIPRCTKGGKHIIEKQFLEEVKMMRLAQGHRNCVKIQDSFTDHEGYYIVMEFAAGGEIYQRVLEKGRYCEGAAARIMIEVLMAVGYLHQNGIVHFDIKPENVILCSGDDGVPEVRLADFGSAFSRAEGCLTPKSYTLAYSAPEVLQRRQVVDEKADMWSLGVLMYVLLSGRHPFEPNGPISDEELMRRIMFQDPEFQSPAMRHVSPVAKDLMKQLMKKDRRQRPSAIEALAHPWFSAVQPREVPLDVEVCMSVPAAPATLRSSEAALVGVQS